MSPMETKSKDARQILVWIHYIKFHEVISEMKHTDRQTYRHDLHFMQSLAYDTTVLLDSYSDRW
jgi:hypothetical protein